MAIFWLFSFPPIYIQPSAGLNSFVSRMYLKSVSFVTHINSSGPCDSHQILISIRSQLLLHKNSFQKRSQNHLWNCILNICPYTTTPKSGPILLKIQNPCFCHEALLFLFLTCLISHVLYSLATISSFAFFRPTEWSFDNELELALSSGQSTSPGFWRLFPPEVSSHLLWSVL